MKAHAYPFTCKGQQTQSNALLTQKVQATIKLVSKHLGILPFTILFGHQPILPPQKEKKNTK